MGLAYPAAGGNSMVGSLNLTSARRIALSAQGFYDPAPTSIVDVRHLRRVMRRVGLLQLDSVSVLARSHYLPMHSRLGEYERGRLDGFARAELFEYWGHEASLLPVEDYPLFRFRMDEMEPWRRLRGVLDKDPGYVDRVYDEVTHRGPLTVSDLDDPGDRTGPWWGYGKGKLALEWLFATGRVTAYRSRTFTRIYDVTERVIPPDVVNRRVPDKTGAHRELLLKAARHLGVGTAADLADYYRLHVPTARPVLDELAGAGLLDPVRVEGWRHQAYRHPDVPVPRRDRGTALLSPFDSLIWTRDRAERLFGFKYRIEIYVPEPKRVHGYYVLPFLLDGELVGRVDLKARRRERILDVRASHSEPAFDRGRVAAALLPRLVDMAHWLGLDEVSVRPKGDLASALLKTHRRSSVV